MDHDEYADEAIFDDLYDDEPAPAPSKTAARPEPKPVAAPPTASVAETNQESAYQQEYTPAEPQQYNNGGGNMEYHGYQDNSNTGGHNEYNPEQEYGHMDGGNNMQHQQQNNQGGFFGGQGMYNGSGDMHGNSGEQNSTAIKEDGKMFIGGLNWETTDESLRDYFSQFGEVSECTVMRDGPSGRSRGFGFLTFKDPKTVNIVMVKEHYLDGKIIDPKRAIPRDEQERTSKIFVGGVSQDATESDFREYFQQFGRVIDSTLMMDKETGRPRGFGFVTFDNEAAVDAALAHPDLRIHDKPIEVKKAQPRGNTRERNFDDDGGNRHGNFRDRGHRNNRFENQNQNSGGGQDNFGMNNNVGQVNPNAMGAGGANPAAGFQNGMSPAMLAQYWQRMQQYWMMMMQQQNMMRPGGGAGQQPPMMPGMPPNMSGFNPQMMQQMQQQMGGMPGGPGGMPGGGMPGGMNPMGGMGGMPGMGVNPGQGQGGQIQGGPGGNQGYMSPPGGFQPKSPSMQMQQPYGGNDGSEGGQSDQKGNSYPSGNSQGDGNQMNQWGGSDSYDDNGNQQGGGVGSQGQGNRGMHGGGGGGAFHKQNFNAPTGPKGAAAGPPPNAPTGPRNARNAPSGPSGGGGGPGPYRNNRGGYNNNNRGFHPYQRN